MTTDNPDPLEVAKAALSGTGADHHDIEAAAAIIAQHYAPVIAREARLREALRPFAEHMFDPVGIVRLPREDYQRARQALGAKP